MGSHQSLWASIRVFGLASEFLGRLICFGAGVGGLGESHGVLVRYGWLGCQLSGMVWSIAVW